MTAALLGRTEPRIFTPPLRELTEDTSLGFDVIAFASLLGVSLYPYQRWLLVHALELKDDGTLRFRTVLVLIARQNGKTFLSVLLGLFWLYVLRVRLILGSAPNLDLAEETWQAAVDLVTEEDDEGRPVRADLAREVKRVKRVNGQKSLELHAGPKWRVKATNRKAGRGQTAGLLFLDELREHQTWEAWAALTKTTLAVADALVWCMTNAGDASSAVLMHLRRLAHTALGDPDGVFGSADTPAAVEADGEDVDVAGDDLAIFEWSAAPHRDVWDRDGWCEANPALGYGGMSERTIASAVRTDPPAVVRTEVLCQWVLTAGTGPFPAGAWESGVDPESTIPEDGRVIFSVAVSYDRAHTTLAATGFRADGRTHTEIVARRAGTEWVREWVMDRCDPERPMLLAGQTSNAPVASVLEGLSDIPGLEVVPFKGADLGIGHALFFDLVTREGGSQIMHRPQPVLDVPAATAQIRPLSEGVWVWKLRTDGADTAPLAAVTAGVWALHLGRPERVSAYESTELVVV